MTVTRLFEFKNISLQIIPPNHLSISQLFLNFSDRIIKLGEFYAYFFLLKVVTKASGLSFLLDLFTYLTWEM